MKNNLSEGGVTTLFTADSNDPFDDMALNGEYKFNLYVKNDSLKEKNNVVVKMEIPKELTLINSDYNKVKYDERTRELTLDIGTLKTRYDIYKDEVTREVDPNKTSYVKIALNFRFNNKADAKSEIELKVDTYVDSRQKVDTSKILKYSLKNALNADVSVNSNVGNNKTVLDTDVLEYVSEVVNKSDDVQRILIVDKLPTAVSTDKYFIKKEGDQPQLNFKKKI